MGSKSIQALQGIWEKEREKNTNDCEKRETQRRIRMMVKREGDTEENTNGGEERDIGRKRK